MIERIARAKINLALHVTGLREDNYHLLDSVVVFSEFGDHVRISPGDHDTPVKLTHSGPFADNLPDGKENLAGLAAELLRNEIVSRRGVHPPPVSIHLTKNLPIASGIGGGSSDAAAVLSALRDFWECDLDLSVLSSRLGADVAMCLQAVPLRAEGIGEEITLLVDAPELNLLLVNSGVAVSTPQIFRALENKNNLPIGDLEDRQFPDMEQLAKMRNDLQAPAATLNAEILTVLSCLKANSPLIARMSGSGATCFGVFETAEETEIARERIVSENPDWWCVATRSTVS